MIATRNGDVDPRTPWYQPWLALTASSVLLNGTWEWFARAYYEMPAGSASLGALRAGCLLATLGDAAITNASYAVASAIGTRYWLRRPSMRPIVLYLGVGLLATIVLEYVNVNVLHRWAYVTGMPVVAGLGALPLLQWLLLPPIVLVVVRRYLAGGMMHTST